MPMTIAIVVFFVVLAVVLIAVSLGLRYMESARKKQVFKVLETVSGRTVSPAANLLKSKQKEKTWVEVLFASVDLATKVRARLQTADLAWTFESFVLASLGLAAVGMLVGTRLPLPSKVLGSLAVGGLFSLLPHFYISKKRSKRLKAMEEQLPDAMEFLARSMRAGHALTVSLSMVGEELADPLGREFRTMFNEQRLGAPMETALENLCRRVPLTDLHFFASALLLQRQTGGNLAEILRQLAQVVRERFRLHGQVKALAAHGKLTSMILTILPLVTTGLLMMISPEYLGSMADDPDGKKLIIAAAVMMIIGSIIVRRIIKIEV